MDEALRGVSFSFPRALGLLLDNLWGHGDIIGAVLGYLSKALRARMYVLLFAEGQPL